MPVAVQAADAATYAATYTTADATTYTATYTTHATTYTATHAAHAAPDSSFSLCLWHKCWHVLREQVWDVPITSGVQFELHDLRRPIKILGACRLPCFPELLRCNWW
jgi:hypothetical protein